MWQRRARPALEAPVPALETGCAVGQDRGSLEHHAAARAAGVDQDGERGGGALDGGAGQSAAVGRNAAVGRRGGILIAHRVFSISECGRAGLLPIALGAGERCVVGRRTCAACVRVASRGRRLNSGSPERSSWMLARLPRRVREMRASGSSVSTLGRRPSTSSIRSHSASFTRSAAKWELRSSSLVPRAVTAMVAPARRIRSQAMERVASYRSSASVQAKRPSTTKMRLARRDHRHARSASAGEPANATRPLSGRTWRSPMPRSSSASAVSKPSGQLA